QLIAGAAMANAEQLTPELYRELAEKLRELAREQSRTFPWDAADCHLRHTLVAFMFENKRGEKPGDDLQWKELRKTLLDQMASIIGRWRESCGNWPVNVVSQARAESCLILPNGMSEEPIT